MNDNNSDTVILGNDTQDKSAAMGSTPTSSTSADIIFCAKCGGEMKKTARYCMKCGNLNYAHPDNESMKQYAWQSIKQGHFISGANIDKDEPLTMGANSVSNHNPFKPCLITNIIIFVLLTIVFLIPVLLTGEGLGYAIFVLLFMGYMFLLSYSSQCILIKGGQPWWSAFVPIYGSYTSFAVSMGNGWFFLLGLIPIVNIIVGFLSLFMLGKRFYKSGLLTMLFPFVMIPVIGLDKESEMSIFVKNDSLPDNTVDKKGRTQSERIYRRNKFMITTIIIVLVSVALYLGWPYLQPLLDKVIEFVKEQLEFYK